MKPEEAADLLDTVRTEIQETVIIDDEPLDVVLATVLARGHVLLEDVPGTGKTLTAQTLAEALGLEFNRIQFTPDLLPGDVTGSEVYDETDGSFRFEPGPIFANVVLADEINRAPPKTQAALLEAMSEGQVSVGGETHSLPEPFFVLATQNPVEQEGTFELPEAQLDRFMSKTDLGYPGRSGERTILDRRESRETSQPEPSQVVKPEAVPKIQAVAEDVDVADSVKDYIVDVARATRGSDSVATGVSPRGVQKLFEASRSHAALNGRSYVVPDDVHAMVNPVLTHRVILTTEARVRGVDKQDIVDRAVEALPVPSMEEAQS